MIVQQISWPSDITSLASLFCEWMFSMSWQVAILVTVLCLCSWFLRNRVSARFLYGLWLIVPVRLVLPPSLALVVGWGWWLLPTQSQPKPEEAEIGVAATQLSDSLTDPFDAQDSANPEFVSTVSPVDLPSDPNPIDQSIAPFKNSSMDQRRELPFAENLEKAEQGDESRAELAPLASNDFPSQVDWRFAIFTLWLLVSSILITKLLTGLVQIRKLVRNSWQPDDQTIELAKACHQLVGLRRTCSVFVSSQITTPMLVGFFRPVILLPVGCENHLSRRELRSVLIHELQHVARRDPLVLVFTSLLTAVYWFHPFVWLAQWQLRRLRELACDESTLASLENSRKAYASGLIKVAELIAEKHPLPAVGFVERKTEMSSRVMKILDKKTRIGRGISLLGMLCILVIGAVAIPGAAKPSAGQPVLAQVPDQNQITPQSNDPQDQELFPHRADEEIIASRPYQPLVKISGQVLGPEGKPAAESIVTVRYWEKFRSVKTDKGGRFSHSVPVYDTYNMLVTASNEDGSLIALSNLGPKVKPEGFSDLELRLEPSRMLTVKVLDQKGNPAANARVGCTHSYRLFVEGVTNKQGEVKLRVPRKLEIDFIFAGSRKLGLDYRSYMAHWNLKAQKYDKKPEQPKHEVKLQLAKRRPVSIKLEGMDGKPIPKVMVYPLSMEKPGQTNRISLSFFKEWFRSESDQNGIAKFDWMPDWPQSVEFYPSDLRMTFKGVTFKPDSDGKEVKLKLSPKIPIQAKLVKQDGSPAVNVPLHFQGVGAGEGDRRSSHDWLQGYTDERGIIQLYVDPYKAYLGISQHKKLRLAEPLLLVANKADKGKQLKFKVREGTRIRGQVRIKSSGRPLANEKISFYQYAVQDIPVKGGGTFRVQPLLRDSVTTDQEGRYEILVGAGRYNLSIRNPSQYESVDIKDENEVVIDFDSSRPETAKLSGLVVDADGKPVPDVEIWGAYGSTKAIGYHFIVKSNNEGMFEVDRELVKTVVRAMSKDGKLGAAMKLAKDAKTIKIELKPTVDAAGRLVDAEGKAMPNRKIKYYRRLQIEDEATFKSPFGDVVTTDKSGKFILKQLVKGMDYDIALITSEEKGMGMSWSNLLKLNPKTSDEKIDLGEVRYAVQKRLTLVERIQNRIKQRFKVDSDPLERINKALSVTSISGQPILILIGDVDSQWVRNYYRLPYENQREFGSANVRFVRMAIQNAGRDAESARSIAKKIGVELDKASGLKSMLVVLDAKGKQVATLPMKDFVEKADGNQTINTKKVIEFLNKNTPPIIDARRLLAQTLIQAKMEKKRIIIQGTSRWYGAEIELARFFHSTRSKWAKDFIWLDINRGMKNGPELLAELSQNRKYSLPWTAIVDADGKTLCTSNGKDGINMGYPVETWAKAHLKSMFMKGKQRLTEKEIDQIVAELKPYKDPLKR